LFAQLFAGVFAGAVQVVVAARRQVLILPTLALTSTSLLLPFNFGTQSPSMPSVLVPALENPLGRNVNLYLLLPLAPERFVLVLTTTLGCNVLSRKTVVAPFFVIVAIQRLPSVAAQAVPFVLGQTATLARLLTAAILAVCSIATISLAEDVKRFPRMRFMKLGTASAANIPRTIRVIINSTMVKPRSARDPEAF
jgi:hypothetical protein